MIFGDYLLDKIKSLDISSVRLTMNIVTARHFLSDCQSIVRGGFFNEPVKNAEGDHSWSLDTPTVNKVASHGSILSQSMNTIQPCLTALNVFQPHGRYCRWHVCHSIPISHKVIVEKFE